MGRARVSGWAGTLCVVLAGCSSSAPGSVATPAPAASPVDLPPGAAEVAAFRGHAYRRSIPVHEVTRARMRHVVAADVASRAHPDERESEEAFMKAFGFIPLSAKISPDATARLQGDALVGLYVPSERAVYVRPRTRTSAAIDGNDVLHELEHALQDDVFGLDVTNPPREEDARLALHAVYEGDATVVAWGVAGLRAGRSAADAIAERRLNALAESATLGVAQEVEAIPGWAGVPRITQVEMFFPYTAGCDLVAEAYLAGGTPLMDGLFRKPPVSTEQVLHAAKYFNGEAPIPVRVPAAPAGYVVQASGTMGELRTRALLELALPADVAVAASTGWGGDAYAVLAREDTGAPAVLWSTAWDDVAHATRFAAAMEQAFGAGAGAGLGPVRLRQRGANVAWTRGIDDASQLDALLALPGEKPRDDPPHGHVVLPSTQVGRDILVPVGGDPHLVVASLGLAARLPAHFARIQTGSTDITVQEGEQHGRGTLSHEAKPFDASAFPALVTSIAPVFAANFALGNVELSDVSLPIGQAKQARWPFLDGTGEARFLAMPFCGGAQTLFVTTVARSEEARIALTQWIRSFEPTQTGLPAICRARATESN